MKEKKKRKEERKSAKGLQASQALGGIKRL